MNSVLINYFIEYIPILFLAALFIVLFYKLKKGTRIEIVIIIIGIFITSTMSIHKIFFRPNLSDRKIEFYSVSNLKACDIVKITYYREQKDLSLKINFTITDSVRFSEINNLLKLNTFALVEGTSSIEAGRLVIEAIDTKKYVYLITKTPDNFYLELVNKRQTICGYKNNRLGFYLSDLFLSRK